MSMSLVRAPAAVASEDPGLAGPREPERAMPPGLGKRLNDAWPLWAVLVAQAVLTVPWLWRTAPFTDEALYIEAGHAEWAHWLQHVAGPDYASWFSGAPVLYPPVAAAADSAGGLPAARAVSLIVMFAATALVYLMGCHLFNRRIGGLAAAVFAVGGLTVHYGAFATFGPFALFLLTLAAWAAVRVRDGGFWWLPACVLALVAANAAKYATLLWDPVVVGMLVLHGWEKGIWQAIGRACSVTATVLILEAGLLMLGGADYARGLIATTLFRSIHWGTPSSAAGVLARAFLLVGVVVLTGALGVIVSVLRRRPPALTLFLCLLVLAALLAPIDQARIHQLPSLDKNIGFGLPFAALGAGYALGEGRSWLGRRRTWGKLAAAITAAVVLLAVLVSGRLEGVQFRGPGIAEARKIVAAIRHGYRPGTYVISDGGARMEQYYLPDIPPGRWLGMFASNAAQRQRIARDIKCGQVSVVVLRKSAGRFDHPYDRTVARMLAGRARKKPTVVTQGKYSTDVYATHGPARRLGSCQ
jgi:4-amino-4-deoxy-L-arabinose transferase-like glycosyltransferase